MALSSTIPSRASVETDDTVPSIESTISEIYCSTILSISSDSEDITSPSTSDVFSVCEPKSDLNGITSAIDSVINLTEIALVSSIASEVLIVGKPMSPEVATTKVSPDVSMVSSEVPAVSPDITPIAPEVHAVYPAMAPEVPAVSPDITPMAPEVPADFPVSQDLLSPDFTRTVYPEPITLHSPVTDAAPASTLAETSSASTLAETTSASTLAETSSASTLAETSSASTLAETSSASTLAETSSASTLAETSSASTLAETSSASTLAGTSSASTLAGTSSASTLAETSSASTLAGTSSASTLAETSSASTLAETSSASTLAETTSVNQSRGHNTRNNITLVPDITISPNNKRFNEDVERNSKRPKLASTASKRDLYNYLFSNLNSMYSLPPPPNTAPRLTASPPNTKPIFKSQKKFSGKA